MVSSAISDTDFIVGGNISIGSISEPMILDCGNEAKPWLSR